MLQAVSGRLRGGLFRIAALLLLTVPAWAQPGTDPIPRGSALGDPRTWKPGTTTSQLEQMLTHNKVLHMKSMQSVLGEAWQGSSAVFLLELEGGIQAVFRSEDEPWASRAELGGYHVDRWLGTELVPPTVERTLVNHKTHDWPWKGDKRSGSLQFYVPPGKPVDPENPDLADGEVLSFVMGRYDNHSGNLLSDRQGQPALIDFESCLDLEHVQYGDFPFVRRGGPHADPRSVSRHEPFPFDKPLQLVDPSQGDIEMAFGPWWDQFWPEGMEGLYRLLDGIPGRTIPYAIYDDRLWVQVRVRSRHPACTNSYNPALLKRLAQLDAATLRGLLPEPFGEAQIQGMLERRDQLLKAARDAS